MSRFSPSATATGAPPSPTIIDLDEVRRCRVRIQDGGAAPSPTIIGLDTSTRGWYAVIWSGSHAYEPAYVEARGDADQRRIALYRTARSLFATLTPCHVFSERPLAMPRNPWTSVQLGLAAGAIWAASVDYDVTWYWVPVSAWKRAVIGDGAADKSAIRRALAHVDWPVPDLYDAHALCIYGRTQLATSHGDL